MKRVLATVVALCAASLIAAGVGTAAPQQPQTLTCGGGLGDIQITAGPANGADQSWGAAQIVGGGHLIPLAFSFTAVDVTVGQTIFSATPVKGGGHAAAGGPTTTCSQTEEATLADFLEPGESPPPGTSLSDDVVFTLTALVAVKQ